MADTDGNPEDEYADDEYADHHAEDLEEPFVSTRIPNDEPEADVLEQRQEVPYDQDEDEPWWDKGEEKDPLHPLHPLHLLHRKGRAAATEGSRRRPFHVGPVTTAPAGKGIGKSRERGGVPIIA